VTYSLFFNADLVDDPDTFLAADLFRDWPAAGGRLPGVGECAGFTVPLFLGGTGTAANLGLNDLEVCWSLAAQWSRSLVGGGFLTGPGPVA
jgi:hypothetical protein